jgi:cytochrome c biogenesis protein CcmG, thiol:disulfide interchange protein DsbE
MAAMRTRALVLAVAALVAVVGIVLLTGGSSDSGGDKARTDPAAERAYAGAPPPLRALYDDRNQLLDGGADAFERRIAELRGYPVVVNKWASWCGPCRFEFPVLQQLAAERGGEIAFLGVDSNDSEDAAATFLEELPLPYPSYSDPGLEIAQDLGGPPQAFPTTSFYDRTGKLVFTHPGPYSDKGDLVADLNRYAR